eukprot:TRINITY_DN18432_c0_g1_i1.p1 TRINITY_DN18432_c0_g1~~TRINITY_DN18432_c0_g1_i1.p1  ORF type:complete len:1240 (-),score=329.16 TRINITY_DN18432_c0_g1_i1:449-4168(-)
MVELRLDSVISQDLPTDCFLSVRIGDAQKLARLASGRVFRFPQAKVTDQPLGSYGRVEVFQRIGSCTMDVDSRVKEPRELGISCADHGFGFLGLKVHVDEAGANARRSSKEAPRPAAGVAAPTAEQPDEKLQAAKTYLNKHAVEVHLSQAMHALLREKPDNPAEFLATRLLELQRAHRDEATACEPSPQEPPTLPTPAVVPRQPVPPSMDQLPAGRRPPSVAMMRRYTPSPTVMPMSSMLTMLPFRDYYRLHFVTGMACGLPDANTLAVHSKFPAAESGSQRPALPTLLPRVATAPMSPPTSPAKPFRARPSVGTWLTRPKLPAGQEAASKINEPPLSPTTTMCPPSAGRVQGSSEAEGAAEPRLRSGDEATQAALEAAIAAASPAELADVLQQLPRHKLGVLRDALAGVSGRADGRTECSQDSCDSPLLPQLEGVLEQAHKARSVDELVRHLAALPAEVTALLAASLKEAQGLRFETTLLQTEGKDSSSLSGFGRQLLGLPDAVRWRLGSALSDAQGRLIGSCSDSDVAAWISEKRREIEHCIATTAVDQIARYLEDLPENLRARFSKALGVAAASPTTSPFASAWVSGMRDAVVEELRGCPVDEIRAFVHSAPGGLEERLSYVLRDLGRGEMLDPYGLWQTFEAWFDASREQLARDIAGMAQDELRQMLLTSIPAELRRRLQEAISSCDDDDMAARPKAVVAEKTGAATESAPGVVNLGHISKLPSVGTWALRRTSRDETQAATVTHRPSVGATLAVQHQDAGCRPRATMLPSVGTWSFRRGSSNTTEVAASDEKVAVACRSSTAALLPSVGTWHGQMPFAAQDQEERQQTGDISRCLREATNDGRLQQALQKASAARAASLAQQKRCEVQEQSNEHAAHICRSLRAAADDGRLRTALQKACAPVNAASAMVDHESVLMERSKLQAAAERSISLCLRSAADDGRLLKALQNRYATVACCGVDKAVNEAVSKRLQSAAVDGSLMAALAACRSMESRPADTPADVAGTGCLQRTAAAQLDMAACKEVSSKLRDAAADGRLAEALAKRRCCKTASPQQEEVSRKLRDAAADGRLAEALAKRRCCKAASPQQTEEGKLTEACGLQAAGKGCVAASIVGQALQQAATNGRLEAAMMKHRQDTTRLQTVRCDVSTKLRLATEAGTLATALQQRLEEQPKRLAGECSKIALQLRNATADGSLAEALDKVLQDRERHCAGAWMPHPLLDLAGNVNLDLQPRWVLF